MLKCKGYSTLHYARDMPHMMMTQIRVGIQGVMCLDNLNLVLAPWLGYVNCFSEHLGILTRKSGKRAPRHTFLDWCLSVSFVIGFLKDIANEFVTVRL